MDENKKYAIIKKLVETNRNKKRAALELNCTPRHINRMIQGYDHQGKAYFAHSNYNCKSSHTIDIETRNLILSLYTNKYSAANFKHFTELLVKHEKIKKWVFFAIIFATKTYAKQEIWHRFLH